MTKGLEAKEWYLKNTVNKISSLIKIDPLESGEYNLLNETKNYERLAIEDSKNKDNFSKTIEQLILNITGNTIMNDNDIQNLTDKIGYNLKIAGM